VSTAVVDASVWIAAIDPSSPAQLQSRACLEGLTERGWHVAVPTFARLEVACALARKLRNPARARRITESLWSLAQVRELPLDAAAIERALVLGTERFLRGPDATYAADAISNGFVLLSWDRELRARARAVTPAEWLQA